MIQLNVVKLYKLANNLIVLETRQTRNFVVFEVPV